MAVSNAANIWLTAPNTCISNAQAAIAQRPIIPQGVSQLTQLCSCQSCQSRRVHSVDKYRMSNAKNSRGESPSSTSKRNTRYMIRRTLCFGYWCRNCAARVAENSSQSRPCKQDRRSGLSQQTVRGVNIYGGRLPIAADTSLHQKSSPA